MSKQLTAMQQIAIAELLTGASAVDVAKTVGVAESTIRRWKRDAHFAAELINRSGEMLDDATRGMTLAVNDAPSVIREIMNDAAMRPSVRLSAAKIAIEAGLKLIEVRDVIARIERLEAKMGGTQ